MSRPLNLRVVSFGLGEKIGQPHRLIGWKRFLCACQRGGPLQQKNCKNHCGLELHGLSFPGSGLVPVLREAVERGRTLLGICIGMQLLFEESEEFGPVAGLGVLPGRVVRFAPDPERKIPHMGWNALRVVRAAPALAGIDDGAYVYFVHSYYPVPADPAVVATTTPYGPEFASSVARDNVFACQFHPEKSQQVGLRLLDNFVRQLG